jgi:hypothetical protein
VISHSAMQMQYERRLLGRDELTQLTNVTGERVHEQLEPRCILTI